LKSYGKNKVCVFKLIYSSLSNTAYTFISFQLHQIATMKIFSVTFSVLSIMIFLTACNQDSNELEVTYIKATPIYADLEPIRDQDLVAPIRDISNPGKVYVSENLLLIGEEREGIHVFDNSDPATPTAVSFIAVPGNNEFYVQGNYIYAESYYDMLKIDISDMLSPQLVNRVEEAFSTEFINDDGEALIGFEYKRVTEEIDENTELWRLTHNEDVAYFDFNDKLIPASAVPSTFAGSSDSKIGSVNRIAYSDGYLYAISNEFLTVFEDDAELSLVRSSREGNQMETIYPFKKKLYVGTRNSMEIFSTMDPANPILEATFVHANACDPVLPSDDVAYVTLRTDDDECAGNATDALLVVNTSNVFSSYLVEEIAMNSPYGLSLIGDKLYVGEGSNGLKIFDATNKYELELITYDKSVEAYDIIDHPTKANIILIASPAGFGQYEVSNENQNLDLISWIAND